MSVDSKTSYQAMRAYLKQIYNGDGYQLNAVRESVENTLTARQKELVKMYYFDQMLMQDIADELGLHISSVSRTLKRARVRLGKTLKACYRTLLIAGEVDE